MERPATLKADMIEEVAALVATQLEGNGAALAERFIRVYYAHETGICPAPAAHYIDGPGASRGRHQGACNRGPMNYHPPPSSHRLKGRFRGRSSGVEHNLAKVGVEGSNPFARSIFIEGLAI